MPGATAIDNAMAAAEPAPAPAVQEPSVAPVEVVAASVAPVTAQVTFAERREVAQAVPVATERTVLTARPAAPTRQC